MLLSLRSFAGTDVLCCIEVLASISLFVVCTPGLRKRFMMNFLKSLEGMSLVIGNGP